MKTDGSDQNQRSRNSGGPDTLKSQIARMGKEFERALPGKIGVDRMMRIAMTAILQNPQLAECSPNSFFGSLLQALALGLEVNTPLGQAYLIPRRKKDKSGSVGWECNFQLGYQGLLELCYRYRDGKGYRRIAAEVVYKGDTFDFRYGAAQHIEHIPQWQSQEPTHVWALYETENGGLRFVVWSWAEVLKHASDFSDAYDKSYSAWKSSQTSMEEMAKKTVLKSLLKYAPKSVEIAQAEYADNAVVVARHFEEAGESDLHFEVQRPMLEEDPHADLKIPRERAPQANSAESGDQEPVSVATVAATKPSQKTAPNKLFQDDESDALEQQYERESAGVEGPNFG
jgi:recombination protein RecT